MQYDVYGSTTFIHVHTQSHPTITHYFHRPSFSWKYDLLNTYEVLSVFVDMQKLGRNMKGLTQIRKRVNDTNNKADLTENDFILPKI